MTNFFSELEKTGVKRISIEIIYDNGIASVVVTPKTTASDKELSKLKPIVLRGPVEGLDQEFFNTSFDAIQTTASMFSNVETFEEQKKEIDKQTADKKAKKDEAEKAQKEKKEKLEKAFKVLEAITSSEGYEPKKEKDKVLKALDKIFELDSENKKALDFKTNFIKEVSEVSLFGDDELNTL